MGGTQGHDSGPVCPVLDAFPEPWIAPVPGTTNPAHLDDFLGGASVRLSEPELKEFDLACSRIPLMGHRADPFTESQIDK